MPTAHLIPWDVVLRSYVPHHTHYCSFATHTTCLYTRCLHTTHTGLGLLVPYTHYIHCSSHVFDFLLPYTALHTILPILPHSSIPTHHTAHIHHGWMPTTVIPTLRTTTASSTVHFVLSDSSAVQFFYYSRVTYARSAPSLHRFGYAMPPALVWVLNHCLYLPAPPYLPVRFALLPFLRTSSVLFSLGHDHTPRLPMGTMPPVCRFTTLVVLILHRNTAILPFAFHTTATPAPPLLPFRPPPAVLLYLLLRAATTYTTHLWTIMRGWFRFSPYAGSTQCEPHHRIPTCYVSRYCARVPRSLFLRF